jgi:hypothetical protein
MILFIWFYHVRENYRQTDSMSSAINEPLDYAGSFLLFSKWESYYTTRLAAHVWNLYNIKRFPFSLGQHEERDVADACIITIKRGRGFLILYFLRHWVCNGAPRVGVFLLAPFFSLNSNFVNKTRIKRKQAGNGLRVVFRFNRFFLFIIKWRLVFFKVELLFWLIVPVALNQHFYYLMPVRR